MDHYDQQDTATGLEIAIIGISGRFPGAASPETFWRNLCDGVESIAFFSEQEVEPSPLEPELPGHPNHVRAAGVLEDVDRFDAAFFGYTPREAEIMDPQFRVFFECAWEALERAGYDPETAEAAIGVFAGAGRSSYLFNNLYTNRELFQESGGVFQTVLSNTSDQLTTMVSYKLNLTGPSVAVQTACSTSLVAVHLACQSLLIGDCEMALAGGVSIGFPQRAGYLYQEGGILSPDGHCRAFDASAQGTVNGYGAGVVVLKRLANALADGDQIYAVIKGSAINNDGSSKAGYTAPSIDGQAKVISAAHVISEVDPATISYVEAHGTGTPLGDPIEIAALTQAFRAQTEARNFCAIGSVKSNIGHLDAAAGVTGLIKTALALKHRQLPPSLHFQQPNPKIDFANSPFYVNTDLKPWRSSGAPRHAAVSSFGIGGTNAHVILEEAPQLAESGPGRSAHLLVLSARTESALAQASNNLAAYLDEHPNVNLADVAYTLQVGRKAFNHRRVLVCRESAEAAGALRAADPKRTHAQNAGHRPIIFMFPGQGAQYAQMSAELYAEESVFRQEIDRCAELLKPALKLDLRDVLYPKAVDDAQVQQINQTWLTQPALFVVEYALARLLQSWGVEPHALIGHSIGEYVAATLAGVFSLEDALKIVALRGRLIQDLPPGSMLVVPLPAAEVQALLRSEAYPELSLAASNGLSVSVVSGPNHAVAVLRERLERQGVECRVAHTSHAFHSAMMDPILEPFVEQLRHVALNPPQMRYLSNLSGTWITAEQATDPQYWASHLRQTVRFIEGVQELATIPEALFLEVGPGHTLSTLAKQCLASDAERRVITAMRHPRAAESDEAVLLEAIGRLWLAGATIRWKGMYSEQQRRRVLLPTYPFERQRFWIEPQQHSFAPPKQGKQADIADWFYVPAWQQSPLPESPQHGDRRHWLIFLDRCGLGERLAQRLEQRGDQVTTVAAGTEFSQLGPDAYAVHPQQPIDFQALFRTLRDQHQHPTRIVHLWSVTATEDAPIALDRLSDYQDQGFFSLLTLAQILGEQQTDETVDLFVISNNIHDVLGSEALVPPKATLLGASKVIPQEYATIRCRSIDFGSSAGERWSLDTAAEQLLAECSAPSQDDQVAYRHRHRWVRRFEAMPLQPPSDPAVGLRPGGTYLITGGMTEVGLMLAEHLYRSAQARLVLVGRGPLPSKDQWPFWLETHDDTDRLSQTIHAIQRLEAEGAEILLFSADVANRERMATMIDEVRSRFGQIHGVIHTETVIGAGIIQMKTPELAGSVFAPKLTGSYVLESLLADAPPDFLVIFSSTVSLTGGFGQADYCAAHAFADAYAHSRDGLPGTRKIAINWGVWSWDDGQDELMAGIPAIQEQFRLLREHLGMTPAETVDAFARVLSRSLPQVIVSTQELQSVLEQASGLTAMNALEQLEKLREVEPTHARPELAVPYVAPRNEIEAAVATTLGKLLGMQQVGAQDNFFELGGNSLLAIQLVSALRATFQVELHMNSLFEAATVADLAQIIEAAQEQQREREELEALLREIEQFSAAEAQEQLIAELGNGEEASNG